MNYNSYYSYSLGKHECSVYYKNKNGIGIEYGFLRDLDHLLHLLYNYLLFSSPDELSSSQKRRRSICNYLVYPEMKLDCVVLFKKSHLSSPVRRMG